MREFINLVEAKEKSGVMDDLLSFPQRDLLQMYVDEFNDQEAMEYWLQVDADALPETPEIAREWMKANYTEESSRSLAEMIINNMTEEDIRDYRMNDEEMDETVDDYGYDAEAEMDRGSMVQNQIEDVLTRTNTLMDKIGNEQPTAEQQATLNAYADRITELEKSLEG